MFVAGEFPVTVALGVDRSFSMAGEPLRLAMRASQAFLRALKPKDRSMVWAIADGAEVIAPLDSPRDEQLLALAKLTPWSTTALHDSVITALDRLEPERGRQALVLFTDGSDRYSSASVADVLERVRRSNALVYGIGVGKTRAPILAEMAAVSGGRSVQVRNAEALEPALAAIARELAAAISSGLRPAAAAQRQRGPVAVDHGAPDAPGGAPGPCPGRICRALRAVWRDSASKQVSPTLRRVARLGDNEPQSRIEAIMSSVNPEPASHSKAAPPAHLSVRPDGVGPMEVPFLFQQQNQRIGNALGVSVVTHIAVLGLLFLISQLVPDKVYQAVLPDTLPDIVWLADPGPGGGGGGGGNESPEPPKKVELPGKQEVSVPKPPEPVPVPKPEPEPMPEINIPAVQTAAAPVIAPGAITNNAGQHRVARRGYRRRRRSRAWHRRRIGTGLWSGGGYRRWHRRRRLPARQRRARFHACCAR